MTSRRPKPPSAPIRIGLVVARNAFASALYGMTDAFALADLVADRLTGARGRRRFLVTPIAFAATVPAFAGTTLRLPRFDPRRKLDVVVFLPAVGDPPPVAPSPPHVALARRAARRGALVASVCVGAFHLAHAGLLDGVEATTHWRYAPVLAARFPQVRVRASEMVVPAGRIVTAGGMCAYLDLAIYLVARFAGAEVARKCAQVLLVDTVRRKQSLYGDLTQVIADPAADDRLARLAAWLDAHLADAISVPDMARFCRLGERTFLRRFAAAFQQSPHAYLQGLRIERAKSLLAATDHKWSAIATAVGFADESSLRRVFTRAVGASPREYRARAQGLLHL